MIGQHLTAGEYREDRIRCRRLLSVARGFEIDDPRSDTVGLLCGMAIGPPCVAILIPKADAFQHGGHERYRQPHHVEVAAFDARNPLGGITLNAVCTSFV